MAVIQKVLKNNVRVLVEDVVITIPKKDLSFHPEVGQEVQVMDVLGKKVVILEKENMDKRFELSGTPVRKLSYCLFAFFLGSFGIHRFYADQYKTGLLYLLFCWTVIPSILSIIDCIRGLLKTSDEQGYIVV